MALGFKCSRYHFYCLGSVLKMKSESPETREQRGTDIIQVSQTGVSADLLPT